jgi:hypothetical protein
LNAQIHYTDGSVSRKVSALIRSERMPFADKEKQKAYMREYARKQRQLFKKLKAELKR